MDARRMHQVDVAGMRHEKRRRNSPLKEKESARRDKRMAALIQKAQHPYTPAIQSWISSKLGVPFTQVTAEQVQTLIG